MKRRLSSSHLHARRSKLRIRSEISGWHLDSNRAISDVLLRALEKDLGIKFTFDACCNNNGSNAHCRNYACPSRSFLNADLTGHTVWMHAPFHRLQAFLQHYLQSKRDDPSISGCFLVPAWKTARWRPLLEGMRHVQTFAAGTRIHNFSTNPADADLQGLPWDMEVWYDAPAGSQSSTPVVCAVQSGQPSMQFACTANSMPARCLMDTGATRNFVHQHLVSQLKIPMLPTTITSATLADGSESEIQGRVRLHIKVGTFTGAVDAFVLPNLTCAADIILGDAFLIQHDASMRPSKGVVLLKRRGNTRFRHTLRAEAISPPVDPNDLVRSISPEYFARICLNYTAAKVPVELITIRQANKLIKRGANHVLCSIKPSLSAIATSEHASGSMHASVMDKILHDYADIFAPLPAELPDHREAGHTIPLMPDARPIARPMIRLTPYELEECKKMIADLLAKGWIQPSKSPWAAPILFVPKPDGGLRLVLDYRALNKVTVRDRYPLPRIEDLIDKLSGSAIYSSIDLQAGYYQIRITEEDVPKTAFITPLGHFEYRVLCMGLTNAPATFQRVMNRIFAREINDGFLVVYLDDLLIFSKDAATHEQHLRQVMQVMRENKLYAKQSKCEFNKAEVSFLGHVVGAYGVRKDPSKIKTIIDWPIPKTKEELRSFLGLANYFRKFILGYASIAARLNDLLKDHLPNHIAPYWTDEHTKCFKMIQQLIAEDIILSYPDFQKEFELVTDASLLGSGGVLMQDGRPIAFCSHKFTPAESRYTTYEQEFLATLHALREWRCYLEGSRIRLVTDHHPLTFSQTSTPLSRRQARWLEYLERFDYYWEYRKGRLNVADPLSRHPNMENHTVGLEPDHPVLSALTIKFPNPLRNRIAEATPNDPWFGEWGNITDDCKFRNDMWLKPKPIRKGQEHRRNTYLIIVPNDASIKRDIIAMHHDHPMMGHPGQNRTLELIQRSYWWPRMREDVDDYVSKCPKCQMNKSHTGKTAGSLHSLPIPEAPWDSVSLDLIVALPKSKWKNNSILVFVDRLTKMVHMAPCKSNITAEHCARLLIREVIRLHGNPIDVVHDRGSTFHNALWKQLCTSLKIKQNETSAYHPQSDGQTERMNKTIGDTLRNLVDMENPQMWEACLPMAEFAINNAISRTTNHTPFYLNYGYNPRTPALHVAREMSPAGKMLAEAISTRLARAKKAIQAALERQKAIYDAKHKPQEFSVGDKVLLSTKNLRRRAPLKLLPKYIGPFEVIEEINSGNNNTQAYRLDTAKHGYKMHDVFHTSLLHPFRSDGSYLPPTPMVLDEEIPSYEAEALIGRRVEGIHRHGDDWAYKRRDYLVRWRKPPGSMNPVPSDTWEDVSTLPPSLVDDYETRHGTWRLEGGAL